MISRTSDAVDEDLNWLKYMHSQKVSCLLLNFKNSFATISNLCLQNLLNNLHLHKHRQEVD